MVESVNAGDAATDAQAVALVDEHAELLLSAEAADAFDGEALAGVLTQALAVDDGRVGRFDAIAAAVAAEGEIAVGAVRGVLAEAIADDLAWLDERVNAPFVFDDADRPDAVEASYFAAHDLVREVVVDDRAGRTLRAAVDAYGEAAVASAPSMGDARAVRLADIGRLQEFAAVAQYNADLGEARRARDPDAIDAADEAKGERAVEDYRTSAGWLAAARFASDPALQSAARGQPFLVDGSLPDRLHEDQRAAFEDWAITLIGATGPLGGDYIWIALGADDMDSHALAIENRIGP